MKCLSLIFLLLATPATAQCFTSRSATSDRVYVDCLDGSSGTLKRDHDTGALKGDLYPSPFAKGSPIPREMVIEPSARPRGVVDCDEDQISLRCR